jgi:hypothetical protein
MSINFTMTVSLTDSFNFYDEVVTTEIMRAEFDLSNYRALRQIGHYLGEEKFEACGVVVLEAIAANSWLYNVNRQTPNIQAELALMYLECLQAKFAVLCADAERNSGLGTLDLKCHIRWA